MISPQCAAPLWTSQRSDATYLFNRPKPGHKNSFVTSWFFAAFSTSSIGVRRPRGSLCRGVFLKFSLVILINLRYKLSKCLRGAALQLTSDAANLGAFSGAGAAHSSPFFFSRHLNWGGAVAVSPHRGQSCADASSWEACASFRPGLGRKHSGEAASRRLRIGGLRGESHTGKAFHLGGTAGAEGTRCDRGRHAVPTLVQDLVFCCSQARTH